MENTSNLLIEDYPLMVSPKLAEAIGLHEAIILQQVHYWLNSSKHDHDGRLWIYNTYSEWRKQFPFMSERTIWTTIARLEGKKVGKQEVLPKLLIAGNYNKLKIDNTKWYTIDYEAVSKLSVFISQRLRDGVAKIARPLPETTTETTHHINSTSNSKYDVKENFDFVDNEDLSTNSISSLVDSSLAVNHDTVFSPSQPYTQNSPQELPQTLDTFTIANWEWHKPPTQGGKEGLHPLTEIELWEIAWKLNLPDTHAVKRKYKDAVLPSITAERETKMYRYKSTYEMLLHWLTRDIERGMLDIADNPDIPNRMLLEARHPAKKAFMNREVKV